MTPRCRHGVVLPLDSVTSDHGRQQLGRQSYRERHREQQRVRAIGRSIEKIDGDRHEQDTITAMTLSSR